MIRSSDWVCRLETPNFIVNNSHCTTFTMNFEINYMEVIKFDAVISTVVNMITVKDFMLDLVSILLSDEEFTLFFDNVRFYDVNSNFWTITHMKSSIFLDIVPSSIHLRNFFTNEK